MEAVFTELLGWLKAQGYAFSTPTPRTHAIVQAREHDGLAKSVRDAFGWSRPFDGALLPAPLFERLQAAEAITQDGEGWRAKIRVSTFEDRFYLHSAFPTREQDAVFFGPDTYRFVRFVRANLSNGMEGRRICDVGTGAGVAAIELARLFPDAAVIGIDCNPKALRFAAINAAFNGVKVDWRRADSIADIDETFDLIVMNPPYIADEEKRAYRDGGDLLGAGLTLQWAKDSIDKLRPGGRILIYSGSPIVDGQDVLRDRLSGIFGNSLNQYDELDPDVFGEELERPVYQSVERIALIGAVLTAHGT